MEPPYCGNVIESHDTFLQNAQGHVMETSEETLEEKVVTQLLDLGKAFIKTMKIFSQHQEKLMSISGSQKQQSTIRLEHMASSRPLNVVK